MTNTQQNQEIILQRDERRPVKDSTRAPYRWICSLEVEFPEPVLYPLGTLEHPGKGWRDLQPSRKGCGTGLLISPKHVLTASHVIAGLKVVRKGPDGAHHFVLVPARKVTVIPGRKAEGSGPDQPFGSYAARKILINPGFRAALQLPVSRLTRAQVRQSLAADYGIIELPPRPGRYPYPGLLTGWWGEQPGYRISAVTDKAAALLRQHKVTVGGYPGEKAAVPCSVPWHSSDQVVDVLPAVDGKKQALLFYRTDTSAGMSGSPVWWKIPKGQYRLVGVHSSFLKYGHSRTVVNAGALITGAMLRQLKKWRVGYLEVSLPHHIRP